MPEGQVKNQAVFCDFLKNLTCFIAKISKVNAANNAF